jgi:hypothetical protein
MYAQGLAAKGTLSEALHRVEFLNQKMVHQQKEKPSGWSASVQTLTFDDTSIRPVACRLPAHCMHRAPLPSCETAARYRNPPPSNHSSSTQHSLTQGCGCGAESVRARGVRCRAGGHARRGGFSVFGRVQSRRVRPSASQCQEVIRGLEGLGGDGPE